MWVVFAALVVKAVGKFVADDEPNAAEVDRIVHGLIKERRLENARREYNFVERPVVISVDRGRRHAPFLAVHGLIDLGDFAAGFELGRAPNIAEEISGQDGNGAVVAPHLGIADLVADGIELDLGLLLRDIAHPIETVNVSSQRLLKFVHHLQHPCLAIRAERRIHIALSKDFAKLIVHQTDASLPARRQFLLTGQFLRVLKIGIHKRLGEPIGGRVKHMPRHVSLESVQRLRLYRGIDLLEEVGVAHV